MKRIEKYTKNKEEKMDIKKIRLNIDEVLEEPYIKIVMLFTKLMKRADEIEILLNTLDMDEDLYEMDMLIVELDILEINIDTLADAMYILETQTTCQIPLKHGTSTFYLN
jgi:hypothetical protein